jgi:hypothetical protein
MGDSAPFDLDFLTLTEIIRLQNQLYAALTRRFEGPLALIVSDIVGSTAYFARYGDWESDLLRTRDMECIWICLGTGLLR